LAIIPGISPFFEKIPRLLHRETKLAELVGLERFFRLATARDLTLEVQAASPIMASIVTPVNLLNFSIIEMRSFPSLTLAGLVSSNKGISGGASDRTWFLYFQKEATFFSDRFFSPEMLI